MANKFIIEVRARGFTDLNQQLKKADTGMKKFDNTGGKLRGTTSGIRREIGALRNNLLLYTFAIGAASRAMGKFITAASDMQENLNQFRVVFGDASNEALEFSNTLATSFKRSKSDVISLMASLQDTFVPLGFTRKEAAKLSQTLTQLSFDVGSFKNVASPDVARAFTSAIVGNHEAVRLLGIQITEANLKQEGLRLGFFKTSNELTTQQKILARTSLIISSTNDHHGDLIRTQHEFANQVRALNAEYKDLQIQIGEALLPMAKMGLEFGNISRLKGYAVALASVTVAYGLYKAGVFAATASTVAFRVSLIKTGFGIAAIAIGEIAARTYFAEEATKDNTAALLDYDEAIKAVVLSASNPKSFIAMVHHMEKARGVTILSDEQVAANSKKLEDEKREGFLAAAKEIKTVEEALTAMILREQDNRRDGFLAAQEEIKGIRDQLFLEETFQLDEKKRMSLAAQAEIDLIEGKMAKDRDERIQASTRSFKQFSDNIARAALEGQNMGDAVVNALQAIAAELAAQAISFAILSIFNQGLGPTAMGFDLLGSLFGKKAHTGGSITKNGVQAFANGGMVRGKDDVPILAQAGEFIINRNSAQSIGLNQLHAMNETGAPANTINVNIQGGVVQEDYIRNELIPAINRSGVSVA